MRLIFFVCASLLTLGVNAQVLNWKLASVYSISIPEPSDIYYDQATNHFLIVSDKGVLYETDTTGKIIHKSQDEGVDFEAVCIKDDEIYVSEEGPRGVLVYDRKSLKLKRRIQLSYQGPRNSGFEGMVWSEQTKLFYMMIEKKPVQLFCFDAQFNQKDHKSNFPFKDISAICLDLTHKLWLLSDQEGVLAPLSNLDQKTKIPVTSAEGLCFTSLHDFWVVSDDEGKLYHFTF
jgi:uncharacterized protein YjiK